MLDASWLIWSSIGPSWGDPGGLLGRLELTEAQKREGPKANGKLKGNHCFLLLGALQRLLVEPSWSPLKPLCFFFGPLEAILGRHGAILGPLGAILGRFGGMLGHVGGLNGPPEPFCSFWRAPGRCNGRPGTPKSRADSRSSMRRAGGVGPLEDYKNPIRTALGITPRLNVPRARWRITGPALRAPGSSEVVD